MTNIRNAIREAGIHKANNPCYKQVATAPHHLYDMVIDTVYEQVDVVMWDIKIMLSVRGVDYEARNSRD